MGNGTSKTVKINRQLGFKAVIVHVLFCYNFADGITNDGEATLMAFHPTLHPVGTIDWIHINTTQEASRASGPDPLNSPVAVHLEVLHAPDTISVNETPIQDKLQFMDIAH